MASELLFPSVSAALRVEIEEKKQIGDFQQQPERVAL
jgi:hypothetical protein